MIAELLSDPTPDVMIRGASVCFTGKFAQRPRVEYERLVEEAGGRVWRNVYDHLGYLVIGDNSLATDSAIIEISQHKKVRDILKLLREGTCRAQIISESTLAAEIQRHPGGRMAVQEGSEEARQGRLAGSYLVDARFAELIGMCRGVIADRRVVHTEAEALRSWLDANRSQLPEWPTVLLVDRLSALLVDGAVDGEEAEDILRFLDEFVAGDSSLHLSTTLPLEHPEPFIEYAGKKFCLTGTFIFGTRRQVEAKIVDEGGLLVRAAGSADYLVIGAMITPAWKYGTHGLKIEEGVVSRAQRGAPLIVSEEHWVTSLT